MYKLLTAALVAATLAGCAAGQMFGPSLRSQCQSEQIAYEAVQPRVQVAVRASDTTPATKAALQSCDAEYQNARSNCQRAATAGNAASVELYAGGMASHRTTCEGLLK